MPRQWNDSKYTSASKGRGKKTSQGRKNVGFGTMNKHKKRNFKKYRRQG
jgi:hypothetical protein